MNDKINSVVNRLERKVGRYAVPQLTKYMILTYIIGYIIYFVELGTRLPLLQFIMLSPEHVLHGQIWRLFTWIFMPPSAPGIFTIIMLLFYYQIGTALEQTWGDFKYNLYIFSGLILMIIGAFLLYAFGYSVDGMFTTYYVNLSIFLAFAACYPDMQVMLYFLIPLKIKYLAFIDVAFLVYQALVSRWEERVAIIVSLLNFIIFFFTTRNYKSISPKERARKNNFKKAFERGPYYQGNKRRAGWGAAGGFGQSGFGRQGGQSAGQNSGYAGQNANGNQTGQNASGNAGQASSAFHSVRHRGQEQITKHRCAICGRTELDGDMLEFRFCSKCAGNYEYCQDHLFSHTHVKFGK
ncbi:MAG: hypothetical protein IJT96_00990 [Lachnospiraceae bacterium]|nr:hypothetical protein [Lachnospiraceae bacterium]